MRIGVFWPADGCFYSGTVSSFDEPSGCHCIAYDDNENDWLHLAVRLPGCWNAFDSCEAVPKLSWPSSNADVLDVISKMGLFLLHANTQPLICMEMLVKVVMPVL